MIDDPDLRKLFEAESGEHLARLDDGLLRLEKTPADAALIEEAFRESHSLKGAARMLGLARIEAAAHGLESLLNAARKGEAPLTPEVIERMNAALREMRAMAREAVGGEPVAAAQPLSPSPRPSPVNPLSNSLPKGDRAIVPSPASGRGLGRGPGEGAIISPSPATGGGSDVQPAPAAPAPASAGESFRIETVRVETRALDELLTQAGELAVIEGRMQHRLALMDELLDQWSLIERGRREGRPAQRTAAALADFGDLLKEAHDALHEDGARLEATANLLADRVFAIRLLPLSTVFALFPRMVRDLAMERGKEVEFVIEGGDLAVDKRILEEIKDPLMHLLRNAIDHGVESPTERERLGKPRAGRVRLVASRDDATISVEVRDDGRGLDFDAIRRAAVERGIHDEESLSAMTPAQLQQLILMPGFSTSERVTELSGRGVGLDVVRTNVERLKGSLRLESEAGRGLAVRLRLPASLATTRLLLAEANGQRFGIPVEFVHSSRRVRQEDVFSLEGRPAVRLDGEPLIVARLADLLELTQGEPQETLACIVLQASEERLGLLADDLPGEEEVVPRPLGAPLARVRNVTALAMLASGDICAVLNPGDLLRSAHKSAAAPAARVLPAKAPGRAAVLLAEDSALVRAMEKRILEDAGYEVSAAVDGVDALGMLAGRTFAAVVSDIMMPNMDGLALTARIRADARLRGLPVILVTALASDEDKRRGLEAGASAYIPKPSFDQRVLLDTLKRLIPS